MNVLSGNKGEWSELYASLKVAVDGFLQGVDVDLSPLAGRRLSVLQVVRPDFIIRTGSQIVFLENHDGEMCSHEFNNSYVLFRESKEGLGLRVRNLFSKIKKLKAKKVSTQPCEDQALSSFLDSIGCRYLSMSSASKKDALLRIVDPKAGGETDYGFSVKSYVGAPPTLMNASGATSLTYEICDISDSDFAAIRSSLRKGVGGKQKYRKAMEAITRARASLKFVRYDGETFRRNLQQLDDGLPGIFAHFLKLSEELGSHDLAFVMSRLADTDPLGYGLECRSFYLRKLKKFLVACALGMRPDTLWKDIDDATGGFLLIKPDGEIAAFYVTDRQKFESFLLNEVEIQHPTSSRINKKTGEIKNPNRVWLLEKIVEDGNPRYYVHFNAQVRFKKMALLQ